MPTKPPPPTNPGRSGYWSPQTWKKRESEAVVTPFDIRNLTKGAGYELRMGREAFTTAAGQRIDLSGSTKDVVIPPGHFALLLTKERVKIPRDSIGFISVKFKHKAKGLINVSGFHVDPGYDGWLTFSVFNAGPRDITLARDSFCFLLWLAYWDEPIEDAFLYPSDTVDARGATESLDGRMVDDLKGDFCSPMSLKKEFEDFKIRQAQELKEYKERQARRQWIWGAVLFLLGAVVTKGVDVAWNWITGPGNIGAGSSSTTQLGGTPSAPTTKASGSTPTSQPTGAPAAPTTKKP